MIDVTALRGASVRDDTGVRGEVLNLDPSCLTVGWWNEGAPGVREEAIEPGNPKFGDIEVLTLSDGWVPMTHFVEIEEEVEGPRGPTLAEDLEILIVEAKGHSKGGGSPFKTASKTGPALAGRVTRKRNYWKCTTTGKYKYKCTGREGETKWSMPDAGTKKDYNHRYKKWWKNRQQVTAPNTRGKKKYGKGASKRKKKK
jgi:hypothetical protein